MRFRLFLPLAFAGSLALAATAHAQGGAEAWPQRPITVVLPAPAGSPSDIVLRLLVERAQSAFKQPIVVDNRPGANGTLGTAAVARAAPDGQTWLFAPDSVYTINPYVYKHLGFKQEQLDPVWTATRLGQVLVCNPKLGVKSLQELIAKARSTKLNYASGGIGSPGHMTMAMLMAVSGIEMTQVPYKGPAAATNDVLSGEVPCGFLAGATVAPYVKRGQLVALASSSDTRPHSMPEVPTVAESGFPGYDASFSLVLFAPHGTPPAIVKAFTTELGKALAQPEIVRRLQAMDQEIVDSPPAQTAKAMTDTAHRWADVVRKIDLQLE